VTYLDTLSLERDAFMAIVKDHPNFAQVMAGLEGRSNLEDPRKSSQTRNKLFDELPELFGSLKPTSSPTGSKRKMSMAIVRKAGARVNHETGMTLNRAISLQNLSTATIATGIFNKGATTAAAADQLKIGDRVTVVKQGNQHGRFAMVVDPDWNGRVKVQMEGAVEEGKSALKSYTPTDVLKIHNESISSPLPDKTNAKVEAEWQPGGEAVFEL
jgi:hypothetical protein